MRLITLSLLLCLSSQVQAKNGPVAKNAQINITALGILDYWCQKVIKNNHRSCQDLSTRKTALETYQLKDY